MGLPPVTRVWMSFSLSLMLLTVTHLKASVTPTRGDWQIADEHENPSSNSKYTPGRLAVLKRPVGYVKSKYISTNRDLNLHLIKLSGYLLGNCSPVGLQFLSLY